MRQLFFSCTLLILLIAAGVAPTPAGEEGTGQVQLSLEDYTRLVDLARDPSQPPRPAPAGFALGNAQVTVTVASRDTAAGGSIRVRLSIDVLEDEWVLIPVLPPSTPVDSVTINGKPVQLIATGRGLAWSTKTPGSYTMDLAYKVDASRSETGFTLAVPVPEASAITLSSTLPGEDLDVSVIPAAGVEKTSAGGATRLTATIPTSTGVQISWRTPVRDGHSIDRAIYRGELTGDAVLWTAELGVELFTDETVTLPVLSEDLTLSELKVDGKAGTILVEDGHFTTLVRGPRPTPGRGRISGSGRER